MNISVRIIALCLLVLASLASPSRAQSRANFQVVVHDSNPVTTLTRAEIGRLFLKKTTLWEGGEAVDPVNLASDSKVREEFTREIHSKEMRQIQSFWQRMIFSGRATPPPALSSESKVLEYVASNPNAIGYVSSATSIGRGVKTVTITD